MFSLPKILTILPIPFSLKKYLMGAYLTRRAASVEATLKMAWLKNQKLKREIEGQVSTLIRGGVPAEGLAEYRSTLDRLRATSIGDFESPNPHIRGDAKESVEFFEAQIARLDRRIQSMRR